MKRLYSLVFLLVFCTALSAQEYVLEKVTVVSRHSVRAPLDRYLNTLDEMTGDGYQWTRWSVPGSHLTLRGGALEMLFGEYFRIWLDTNHFDVDSLKCQDVYFGASSKQRTIATARAFAAGMLPQMDVSVDYKVKNNGSIGFYDPDYLPLLNYSNTANAVFDTNAFKKEAYRELGLLNAPSYTFLEKTLRMGHSPYAKRKGSAHFDNYVGVCLNFYDRQKDVPLEPTMVGGLKDANMASDAFILQYYEMSDSKKAAFGRKLSFDDWIALASIKDDYSYILFSKAPIISVNVSHCMLKRIQTEMFEGGHKFAFFCTHDSMIEALLAALRAKPYVLPNTIERKTPIGVKLVIEQWREKCGLNPQKYVRIRLLYQSTEQIREMQIMDLDNQPQSFDLDFTGIERADNGMYRYNDFMERLEGSIQAYNATARGQHPWE